MSTGMGVNCIKQVFMNIKMGTGSSTFPRLPPQIESCNDSNILPCGDRSSLYVKQLLLVECLSGCKYSNTQRSSVGS